MMYLESHQFYDFSKIRLKPKHKKEEQEAKMKLLMVKLHKLKTNIEVK